LAVAEHLQVQMVQIQFLDQLHQPEAAAPQVIMFQTQILEVLEGAVVEAQLDLPDWAVLELLTKDIGVETD
jgi:hypothetical protein